MAEPAVRAQLTRQGWQPVGSDAATLRARLQRETALMRDLIRTRGIQLD